MNGVSDLSRPAAGLKTRVKSSGGAAGLLGAREPLASKPWARLKDLPEIPNPVRTYGIVVGKSVKDYTVLEQISSNECYSVVKVRLKSSGMQFALKKVNKAYAYNNGMLPDLLREVEIHSKLSQQKFPWVVTLYTVHDEINHLTLVMEHCLQSLQSQVSKNKNNFMNARAAKPLFEHIVHTVQALHAEGVLHRNINPKSLVFQRNNQMKLTNLKLSMMSNDSRQEVKSASSCYKAPELLAKTGLQTDKVDCWSIGVTFYFCLMGELPFVATAGNDLQSIMQRGLDNFPINVPEEAKDLMKSLLAFDPLKRMALPRILEHPFFTGQPLSAPLEIITSRTKVDPTPGNPAVLPVDLVRPEHWHRPGVPPLNMARVDALRKQWARYRKGW